MGKKLDKEADRRAGILAGNQIRQETLDACKRLKVDPDYIISNLKRLSRFKGRKPFATKIGIVYSDPLDFPVVQLGALKELAEIMDMYQRHDDGSNIMPDIGPYLDALRGAADDVWSNDDGDK